MRRLRHRLPSRRLDVRPRRRFRPWKVEEDGGPEDCTHGVKGCTMCTRACPRFRTWETEIDTCMFGRERTEDEVAGISSDIVLAAGH